LVDAILVAMGFFGSAFARKRNVEHDHESNEATGTMMQSPLGLIFTIDVNSKPTVAFEARQLREAAELSSRNGFGRI